MNASALLARAGRLRSGTHTLRVRGDLAAGLSVRSGGATLDATVTGLLDDLARSVRAFCASGCRQLA